MVLLQMLRGPAPMSTATSQYLCFTQTFPRPSFLPHMAMSDPVVTTILTVLILR
jgi:hypothetical protein